MPAWTVSGDTRQQRLLWWSVQFYGRAPCGGTCSTFNGFRQRLPFISCPSNKEAYSSEQVLKELEDLFPARVVGGAAAPKEPSIILTMQRLNTSDFRWAEWNNAGRNMRYNVYFLQNSTTTVDLCLGNAQEVSSQYPITGWQVEATRLPAAQTRCAGADGALRIKVTNTGGLNVRVVSVV